MPDLTLRAVACITGESVRTLQIRARAGELSGAYRPGKRWWRVRREAVERLRHPEHEEGEKP